MKRKLLATAAVAALALPAAAHETQSKWAKLWDDFVVIPILLPTLDKIDEANWKRQAERQLESACEKFEEGVEEVFGDARGTIYHKLVAACEAAMDADSFEETRAALDEMFGEAVQVQASLNVILR